MELKAISRCFRFYAIACLTVFGLAASEHHGLVKFGTVPVPGATVTATKDDKKAVAITDDNGIYSFPDLEDGTWKLQVEMLTFQTLSKDIGVAPSAPGAEWELKMMSMDEIKPALQNAPPPTAAATPATTAGATAPAGQPALTPAAATATAAATPAKGAPAKGKGKPGATPATPQPGFQRTDVTASAEASSLQSTPSIASADPTQTASDAMVVNGSTSNGIERRAIGNGRKGPRSLYNGGIDFSPISSNYLNARTYSITGEDIPAQAQTNFTLNGVVQGPLWIPHVFRWQGNFSVQFSTQHSRSASNNPEVMPSEAEQNGDFSQVTNKAGSPITVIDPSNGQPFPGGMIPTARISSQAKYLLHFYPLPQFTSIGQAYNFDAPTITRSHGNRITIGINKSLPTKNRDSLNVRFTYAESAGNNENIFGFKDLNHANQYNITSGYNHQFTRSLRGSLNAQYTRSAPTNTPYFANVLNVSGQAGITGNDQTPINWGPPSLNFNGGNGFAGLNDGNPSSNRIQTTALTGQVTYYRRPHTFTIGGTYTVQDWSLYSQQNGRGGFTFTGTTTGFDFASFLLGLPDASNLAFGNADKYLRAPRYAAFIDDDWRVGSSFSVRWGVRWDYGSPVTEQQGRLVNLDIAPGFTNSTPVLASNPVGGLTGAHYPSSLINADKHLVMPNASFAWKPIFGGSMVVRAGYQLAFNTSVYYPIAQQMDQQAPFSKSQTLANSATNPLTLANGFPIPNGVTTNTFAVDPNFKIGYAQTWTTSVTQNITASIVATATYTGIKGTRAAQEFQPNTYPSGSTVVPCPTCLAGYTYLTSNGNSNNHRGNLQIRRRFHAGLLTTFSYTYAKAIDDVGTLGGSSGSIAQNWLDLSAERGLSSFDQRHNFNALFQYSTGVGVRGGALLGGWRGQLIKGWTITSNITVGSGLPFSPVLAGVTSGTGVGGTLRPEYIGGNVYAGAPGRFLNAAAYATPLPGQWGDAGRDSLTGPGQFSMTGSMARSFADHLSLTLNASNPINHPVFTGYNNTFSPTVLNGGNFGQLAGVAGMRKVQATLRWTF